jgi:uncharacterized membrane protein YdjX (TVP38/TMEM64 family)
MTPSTFIAAGALIILVVVAVVARRRLNVPLFSGEGLRLLIAELGPWAPVAFVGVLAVTVVVSHLPGLPLTIAAGMIWGPVSGAALAVTGGLLGSIIAYSIGRYLGGSIVFLFTGKHLTVTPNRGRAVAGLTIFVARLIPLMPFDLISYAAGVAAVPIGAYATATALGMAPSTLLLTYLGKSFTGNSTLSILLTAVAAGAFVAVPLLCRKHRPRCLEGVFQFEDE